MKKQLWTGSAAFAGMLIFILDSRTAIEGARQGIDLCIRTVIPSLFPFFVLSVLLTSSLMGIHFPGLRTLGRLFQIPGGAETILISSFLGGYPVGAQSIAQAYRSGALHRKDATRMLAFGSNAGPAFLFGMAAPLFSKRWMVWLLWGIHIFSAWMVSLIFSAEPASADHRPQKECTLSDALRLSLKTMAQVCGWVVLFRIVIVFLDRWVLWLLPSVLRTAAIGLLELSNGCCELLSLPDERLRFIVFSGILAFGGLCVTMQTISVIKGLPPRYYLYGKLLQTVFSVLLSAAILYSPLFLSALLPLIFLPILRKTQKRYSIPRKAVV